MKQRIEIFKDQVIGLFKNQFCKFSCSVATYKSHPEYKYTSCGMGFIEGYFLLDDLKSTKENYLLLKSWKKEKDIPREDALWDKSEKVYDIIFNDEKSKYFISYYSRMNLLDLIIEKYDDKTYPKVVYEFSLIIADDV